MDRRLILAAIVLALAAVAAASVLMPQGPDDDPGEEGGMSGTYCDALPDGIAIDADTGELRSETVVRWHVFDLNHIFLETDGSGSFTDVYTGYEVSGDALLLDPGMYTVTVGDSTFTVTVHGQIQRTASWTYVLGGIGHDLSLSYEVRVQDLVASSESGADRNARLDAAYAYRPFSELPSLIECNALTDSVERKLSELYVSIGGTVSDRQGYADFIASFVQMCVSYPDQVETDGVIRGYDYGLTGKDEYWYTPTETLYHLAGDCEDSAALLCALYIEAGYEAAMGGKAGHVYAGVSLGGFEEAQGELADLLFAEGMVPTWGTACSPAGGDVIYHAVETTKGRVPAGYLSLTVFGSETLWGTTGFYPVA